MAKTPVIDASHDCESCRAQSSEFYDLSGMCLTCGLKFLVRNRKGDKPPLYVRCPRCEVVEHGWRTYEEYRSADTSAVSERT